MTDPFAVDAALIAVLQADTQLASLCPDGVWYGLAGPAAQRFVIVDRAVHEIEQDIFDARDADDQSVHTVRGEHLVYLVKAVLPDPNPARARQAALRIRALLDGNDTLVIDGFVLLQPVTQVEGVRYPEPDPLNPDRVYQHAGGQFDVQLMRRV